VSTKARKFVEANKRSPVVAGQVISTEHGGAVYTLEDGRRFELTRDECREAHKMTGDLPRWKDFTHIKDSGDGVGNHNDGREDSQP